MKKQDLMIAEALRAGEAALAEIEKVVADMTRAKDWESGDIWLGLFASIPKYYFYGKARRRTRRAKVLMDEFQATLNVIDLEHKAHFSLRLNSLLVLEDLLLDTVVGDFLQHGTMSKNRIQANIARSRIRKMVHALQGNPGEEQISPVA